MSAAEWGKVAVYGIIIAVLLWITIGRYRGDNKTVLLPPGHELVLEHLNDSFRNVIITMTNRIEDHFETEYSENYYLFMEQAAEHFRLGTDYVKTLEIYKRGYPGWVYYVRDIIQPEDENQAWEITLQTGYDQQEKYYIPWHNMAHCIDTLTILNKSNALLVSRFEHALSKI